MWTFQKHSSYSYDDSESSTYTNDRYVLHSYFLRSLTIIITVGISMFWCMNTVSTKLITCWWC